LGNAQRRAQFSVGYDFKRTNNNLLFGGLDISSEATEIHQAVLDMTVSQRWKAGLFVFSATGFFSPGGIGSRNTDAAFQPGAEQFGTPFARAQYAYTRITASQTTPIGRKGFEAVTRMTGQTATTNLLPSEQLAAAGPGLVRGYDPNSVLGSRGVLFTQELWWPEFAPFGSRNPVETARIGVFVDAGMVGNVRRLPDERRWTRTSSTGFMARYSLGPYLEVRGDLGMQMQRQPGRQRLGTIGFISVTAGF
jgi:hemolysin activation/secretion protein